MTVGEPLQDTPLQELDDHLLGARLLAPLKHPWVDVYDNMEQDASPGAAPGVVAECADTWGNVADSLQANAFKSLDRPINYLGVQVCMKGGLLPCAPGTIFQWEPQHEFRGLRHLMAWRRFGAESDRFLAACAVSRVVHEPTLYDTPHNQRELGWPLLLLAESVEHLPELQGDAIDAINKMVELVWGTHTETTLCTLTPAQQKQSGHLAVVSWQHAILVKALGRLVMRSWPDPRAAQLYMCGLRGLDAMRAPGTWSWVKDWDPGTGATLPAESLYNGTSLWTLAAYGESLLLVQAAQSERRAVVEGFVKASAACKVSDKNYNAGVHALVVSCLAQSLPPPESAPAP